MKLLWKCKKKIGGGGGSSQGVCVNEELKGGAGPGGQGGCIEVIVKFEETRKSALRGTYTPGWCVIDFDL